MNSLKLLIDTNIVIALEDPQPVAASLSEQVRLSSEHGVGLFLDGANYDDIERDKDCARRAVTVSKLAKFQRLRTIPTPNKAALAARFGAINTDNDWADVRLLLALDAKATDFLVTQDVGVHRRAERAGLGANVLTVEEALEWLKQTFTTRLVSLQFQGQKFGELLLKQVLWFVQCNKYDLAYVTAYPKHAFLINLLSYYGFRVMQNTASGELVLEKPIATADLPAVPGEVFDFDRAHYPRFCDDAVVRKFCVPIQPDYHRRLFPEIAFGSELPLFPSATFGAMLPHGRERTPGNTIRKVYLCRARITRLRPGDLLFFYMSKDEGYAASQSITTIGIVEQVTDITSADDLIRHTAKRSVFSADDLHGLNPSADSPIKTIDFLLVGHTDPPVRLHALLAAGVFTRHPPQTIVELTEERYAALKAHFQLGFNI
jgi:hypothetical protein